MCVGEDDGVGRGGDGIGRWVRRDVDVHAARHRARRQVRRPSLTHLPIISRRVVVAPAWEKIPQPRRRRVGLKDLRSVGFARADETRDAVDGDGLCGEAAHHEALHRPHPVSTTRRARDYEYNSTQPFRGTESNNARSISFVSVINYQNYVFVYGHLVTRVGCLFIKHA